MPLPLWVPVAAGLAGTAALGYATGFKGEYTNRDGSLNQKGKDRAFQDSQMRTRRRGTFRRGKFSPIKRRYGQRKRKFSRRSRTTSGFKRKRAFAGSGRFTVSKLVKMVESKMLMVTFASQIIANTGTFAAADNSSGEFCFCPSQNLVQHNPADTTGEATATFTGTKIFLKGIHFQTYITNEDSDSSMRVKIACFKTYSVNWAAFINFTQLTQTSGKGSLTHFYDRQYATVLPNFYKYVAAQNTRGGGPTCVFFKEFFIPASASGSLETGGKLIDIYLPLNKMETFHADINETDLTTSPNFMKNGDYVFVIKFFNSRDALGNDDLRLHSPIFKMHFKDA